MYYQLSVNFKQARKLGLRFAVSGSDPDELKGVYWTTGVPIKKEFMAPVNIVLSEDRGGPDMPDFFGDTLPACSDKMIAALKAVNIDNIELIDTVLLNPKTNKSYSNYKLMNVLGHVQAADMKKSTVDSRSEMFMYEFDELVIDRSKTKGLDMFRLAENSLYLIVSEKVKNSLEQAELLGVSLKPVACSN